MLNLKNRKFPRMRPFVGAMLDLDVGQPVEAPYPPLEFGEFRMFTVHRSFAASGLLVSACTTIVSAQVSTIDGSIPEEPELPLMQQQFVNTQFGDNDDPDPFTANGSELCGLYATVADGYVYLFFPGNLESNYNKFELFIDFDDSVGQNVLRDDNPDVDFNVGSPAKSASG